MLKMKLNIQYFASGTINGSSTATNCDCQIIWSSVKDDINNTSKVTATIQIKKSGSGYTKGTFSGTIKIDGTSVSVSKYGTWDWGAWHTVGSASKNVAHNDDGSKTISISGSLTQGGTSMAGTYTASGTAVLDTINRASKLGAIEDFALTDTITIPITKYVSTFTDKLEIKLGSTLIKTINPIVNGQSISFTTSEQTTIKNLMTSPQATLTFILTTYSGATEIGSTTQNANVTTLDKPIYRNIIKKSNGHYQVAINGVVDANNSSPLQVYDDEGNEILNKKVLYENSTGATGNITLSETSANFEYIEIFFKYADDTLGYSSVKLYQPNGKTANLSMELLNNSYLYISSSRWAFNGINLSKVTNERWRIGTSGSPTRTQNSNDILIYRVVGYKN